MMIPPQEQSLLLETLNCWPEVKKRFQVLNALLFGGVKILSIFVTSLSESVLVHFRLFS